MRKIVGAALAAVMAFSFGGTAQAQMVEAKQPKTLVKVLQDAGYRAELTKDSSGDPMIKSGSSGVNFIILFYGCTDNIDCETVQFYASFEDYENGTIEALNNWNVSKRFGKAYRNDEDVVGLELDVDLDDGGMSPALFQDNLEFWVTVLGEFKDYISA